MIKHERKKESPDLSLVEKAKAYKTESSQKKLFKKGEIELALAWARDEISMTQANFAIYGETKTKGSANILYRIAVLLREAYRTGLIKIV